MTRKFKILGTKAFCRQVCEGKEQLIEVKEMSKIYVASSWRNERQPILVEILRANGHEVYDFRNPKEGDNGFHWSEIDEDWQQWTPYS